MCVSAGSGIVEICSQLIDDIKNYEKESKDITIIKDHHYISSICQSMAKKIKTTNKMKIKVIKR